MEGGEIALGRVIGVCKGPGVRVWGRLPISSKEESLMGHLDPAEQEAEMDGPVGKEGHGCGLVIRMHLLPPKKGPCQGLCLCFILLRVDELGTGVNAVLR